MRVIDGLLGALVLLIAGALVLGGFFTLAAIFLVGCFVLWLVLYKGFL